MKTNTIAKLAAAAMAVMMTVSAGAVPVLAASNSTSSSSASQAEQKKQQAMKTALTAVKKRVKIPDRLTEFDYSMSTSFGTEMFSFTWSDKKTNEVIYITYANGIILSYEYKDYRNYDSEKKVKQTFAKLTDAQLIDYAKKAFKMLDPDLADKGKYSVDSINLFGNTATINFDRMENGTAVEGNGGTVTVNKNTGELVSMRIEWFWNDTKFGSTASKLSADEARATYKSLTTLTPIYRIVDKYNEKTEKTEQEAVLLYLPSFTDEIDAVTGKPSTIWDDMDNDKGIRNFSSYYFNSMTDAGVEAVAADYDDDAADEGVNFTAAELKEIEADEGMLKKDEITALLNKDKYTKMPDYVSLDNANLYKDEDTGEYYYIIDYHGGDDAIVDVGIDVDEAVDDVDVQDDTDIAVEDVGVDVNTNPKEPYFYMNVKVNAKTGKVDNFSKSYDNYFDSSKEYPVNANAKIASAAAKHFYGDIFGEYKADESNSEPCHFYTDRNGKKIYTESSRTYYYNRYVNGVQVEGDTIRINVDFSGDVRSISYRYTDVKFPSVPKFDNDKAFEQLFKQIKLRYYYDGYYKKDGTVKTYLLYDINSYILDSKYRIVSWDGTPLPAEKDEDTNYTDIKGIAQENAINTLARYGITLETKNGKFDPNAKLTDKEFAAVVYKATRNYVPYYIECGDYQKEEKAVTLTKKEAAKVFVNVYGGSDYAELKGIYRAPFKDVAATDDYVGYIAIAKALGFASADKNGNYSPDKVLTRAQAMQMIYDYIERLK